MKTSILTALALGLGTAIAMTACSSADEKVASSSGGNDTSGTGEFTSGSSGDPSSGSSGDPSSGSSGDPSSGSSGDPSGSSSTGTSSSSTGGGSDCSTMANWEACDECECAKNVAGCESLDTAFDDACLCGASAPCAQSCTAYCGGADDDPACWTCLDNLPDETCFDAAMTACNADPACAAYAAASETSCANLPDQ